MTIARALAHTASVYPAWGEELWAILDEACKRASGYDVADNRQRWERYISEANKRNNPITIGTVFHLAKLAGWQGRAVTLQGNSCSGSQINASSGTQDTSREPVGARTDSDLRAAPGSPSNVFKMGLCSRRRLTPAMRHPSPKVPIPRPGRKRRESAVRTEAAPTTPSTIRCCTNPATRRLAVVLSIELLLRMSGYSLLREAGS